MTEHRWSAVLLMIVAGSLAAASTANAGEQPAAPGEKAPLDPDAIRRALELRVGHDVHDASTNLFVHEVFGELGVPVDGMVADMKRNGQAVEGEPQAGDLVFYPGFVAVADGKGNVIYPSGTEGRPQFRTIVKRPIEGWYKENMTGVRSFFDAPEPGAIAPPPPAPEAPADDSVDHTANCVEPDCATCADAFDGVFEPDLPPATTPGDLPTIDDPIAPPPAPPPPPALLSKDEATRRLARSLERFQRGLSPQEMAELQRRLGKSFTPEQVRQLANRFNRGLQQPDIAPLGNRLIDRLRVPGPDPAPVDLAELIAREIAQRDGIVPPRKGGMNGNLRRLLDD